MQITVNGAPRELPDDITLEALLKDLKLNVKTTVVELNREVVEQGTYAAVNLSPGDKIELVRFVGGG